MKNSKTAIRELTAKYRSVLKKCALLNAALCLAVVAEAANATVVTDTVTGEYPTGDKIETVSTYTGTESLLPVVSEDQIIEIGKSGETATVTNTGDYLIDSFKQLNVRGGSTLDVNGVLTNKGVAYTVGDIPMETSYNGPRYLTMYDGDGHVVIDPEDAEKRDIYSYSINNFGTLTADQIRNYTTMINYPDAVINADVYNILKTNEDGQPINVASFGNYGTIIGTGVTETGGGYVIPDDTSDPHYYAVVNSAQFMNGGMIYGNVSNTGTLTTSLGNIVGKIDNAIGVLNVWGTLDRDLNGTVEFRYDTQLDAGESHSIDGILTNMGTFTVSGDLTVSDSYSDFSNFGKLLIVNTGSVTSNISNTGVIDNQGIIVGDVTNLANATLTTAMDKVTGTIKNYGFLNTWGELAGTGAVYEGTVNLVDDSSITGYDVQMENVNLSSNLQVSTEMTVDTLVIAQYGCLTMKSGSGITGAVTNDGDIINNGQFNADIMNNGTFNNTSSGLINSGTFINNGTLTADMDKISTLGTLTNNGVFNTSGSLYRDLGGTVNLVGASSLSNDVTMATVNLSNNLDVAKNLTVANLVVSDDVASNINIASTGSISGTVINAGTVNNSGTLNGTIANYGTLNNSKTLNATVTNTGTFKNNAGATVAGNITNANTTVGSFINDGTISGPFTNNGNAQNNSAITGSVMNNSFLYNNAGASITSGVINNGSIQNDALISGDLTNFGIVYNQASASGMGIVDSEITNSGILINNGSITNTVTDDTAANPGVSNAHTIMNYGNIQAKNFTNAGIIHNLGIMGDNVANDETIATIYSSFTNTVSGQIYNNRLIKANTIVNNGIIENYDLIATKTLTNNATLRNQGSIGVYGNEVTVYNNGALYNGNVIYGDVTNNAGADLTTTIYTITGTLINNGTLNTWGDLQSVNGISLNGTTNLVYDSSLKQNATMNNVHVGNPLDLDKKAVMLDLETNKLTANSLTVADNSGVALRVASKDTYGSVAASNYTVGAGTKLSFVLDKGILTEGNTITLPVFTDADGNVANVDFGTILNNRYQITKEDNGAYTISYKPSTSGDVLNYGGDQNVINASVAWLDEDDMPEGTEAATVQNTLHTLAQTDMNAFVKDVRSLMPETAPVAYTLSNTINNKIAEAVEGRFMSRKVAVKKQQQRKGRNGGDVIVNGTTGSVWAKGLYNKTKLDTKLGFDAKTHGVAFGIDGKANEHLTIGVGYAYTGSDVDSKSRKTDVSTHTGILYSEYANGQCFMNAVVDYNRSEYEEKKNVSGTSIKADYTSDVAYARVMGGFHVPVDYFIFTPEAGLRYLWIKMNGYTDSVGQVVHDESTSSLTGVVGLRMGAKTKLIGLDQVMFWPEVAVRGTYDLVEADSNIAVDLPNGSVYTIRGETLERLGVETAAKLGMLSGNVEVSLEYLGKYRKDYYDHTGLIGLKYRF